MGGKTLGLVPFGVLCLLSWELHAQAGLAVRCPQPIARIVSAQGTIELKEASANVWHLAKIDALVCPGDFIRVGDRSRGAILLLAAETVLRIDENTTLQVLEPRQEYRSLLDLLNGVVHFLSRAPRSLEVKTPFVNAAVEGTEFLIRVETNRTFLSVFEGRVTARNASGSLSLTSNQSALVRAGEAPQFQIVVRPRDAVRWALYYQPVLAGLFDPTSIDPRRDLPPALREFLGILGRGDLTAAFDRLDRFPEPERGERFYVYRAALLLSVGRVDEARSDLDRALALSPESGETYALRAVIAIAWNDRQQALSHGREAVARSPRSSAARIALSYALQADFDLEAARDVLLQAVEQRPGDSLAWARLAELWLSLGYLDRALEAAGRAASLAPNLGRTNTVLGFAALAQIKISRAKAAFEKAIGLESENPLPRLGLGLAKIRDGELREGRRDIEIAAALDPNNALVRSYLGKAYFDEKRDPLSADQLALAKKLDPKDPTPWFYDAIRKQTENRPVEALQDLQKSIELNDNRAVYRSRLLLDEDLAARSASVARIYSDLGFEQLALVEGWKSVNTDPGNYSAHRFLADTYAVLPRHEIARVSELLQSQLRQPINITPVQPQLAVSNLFILEGSGPSAPSFNEFNPLFTRDRIAFQANGIVGGNDIIGDDVTVAGVAGRYSLSVGQFHFETDGFRENNDQDQDIYNIFAQVRLSHDTSIQAELRSKDFERGDLPLRFDPQNFMPSIRQEDHIDSLRFGFHHVFSPNSDVIANVSFQRADIDALIPGASEVNRDEDGYTAEVQHLYETSRFKLITGAGHVEVDRKDILSIFFPFPLPPIVDKAQINHSNLYLYAETNYFDNITLTLGASADFFEGAIVDRDQFNPKIGLIWTPFPTSTLRAAAFRTLKRTLISDQTVEPTQVAGFNQFFDDPEGTDAWRYGIGIDQKLSATLFAGAEFSLRDLEQSGLIPFPVPAVVREDAEEQLGRAYLYWAPHPWWALSAEYQYERFSRDISLVGPEAFTEIDTHRFSLGAGFFHPSGFKASVKATYVDQKGEFGNVFSGFASGDDRFWMLDASIGYRLTKRFGLVSLVAKNIFDEKFNFQDTDPTNPRISPERLILLNLSLFF